MPMIHPNKPLSNYLLWGILFLILALAFTSYNYYRAQNTIAKELKNTSELVDSLHIINKRLNHYTHYLNAINHLVDENNEMAHTLLLELADVPDTLLQKALTITQQLNSPEIQIIEIPKPLEKPQNIQNGDEISQVPAIKKPDIAVEMPLAQEEKKESIDKPIFFKSTKGVKIEYAGQIVNGKAQGYGVGLFESGGIYKGNWQNNRRHGKGVYTWKDGEKYEGDFANDKRDGFGTYTWKNGERYEGQWKNDMRDGKGTIYKSNGDIKIAGLFIKDNLQ